MLQYGVIANLIQFDHYRVQIPDLAIGKSPTSITDLPPCFTVGVKGVAAISPNLRLTQTLLYDQKISNLDSSVLKTYFHSHIVLCLDALTHWNLLT